MSRWSWTPTTTPTLDAVSHHDAAFGQGAGIRHRVPARLGGRPVSAPARARRRRPLRPRGRAPPRLCRHHPRASDRCYIWFVSNRRIHGLWQSSIPSRFLDELPRQPMSRSPKTGTSYGGYGSARAGGAYGASRFDTPDPFKSTYSTPGWQRAQTRNPDAAKQNWGTRSGPQSQGAHHRGRTRRLLDRQAALGLQRRRPRLPPQIRLRRSSPPSTATS